MNESASFDFAAARRAMIDRQLRPNGVTDARILDAMASVPRELFVPSALVGTAYSDGPVRLIQDRFLLPPLVLARLMQAADIKPTDRVLDLAPATGYSTIVLSALTSSVVAVEPDALLHDEAERNVATFAPGKASVFAGAPVEACIAQAPFDVIFINGSVEYLPDFLFGHLSNGGRLAAVMRVQNENRSAHAGQARLYKKTGGEISWTALFETAAPPAPGFSKPAGFVFAG